jgi:hypothetical protein
MPRFVILTHDHPFLHWDLMLEKEAVLRTWRLLQAPGGLGLIPAEGLPDHRLAYLDYEGPVTGNRGTVQAFDRGEYVVVVEADGLLELELQGEKLRGRATLRREVESADWAFEFAPDGAI